MDMQEKSKLRMCAETFPQTEFWMDSFDPAHHAYGLEHGSVGITTSPTWVAHMVEDEWAAEQHAMEQFARAHNGLNERELLWQWTLQMGGRRSRCLLPIWEQGNPGRGRFAIQVDVYEYRNAERMLEMARQVDAQGPNFQVKISCTAAGVEAMEAATYEGISIMATLCYSLSQAVAAAEAVERGLQRRRQEGLSNDRIRPVCAVLLGMQEEWLQAYADHTGRILEPEAVCRAGEAICKRIYGIFQSRGYATRVLTAYYRHYHHWEAFLGGDLIMTIPYKWQVRFDRCDVPVEDNMSRPVPPELLDRLLSLPPFRQAWEEEAIAPEAFEQFGPVVQTLRYFQSSYDRAVAKMRTAMLPDPLAGC